MSTLFGSRHRSKRKIHSLGNNSEKNSPFADDKNNDSQFDNQSNDNSILADNAETKEIGLTRAQSSNKSETTNSNNDNEDDDDNDPIFHTTFQTLGLVEPLVQTCYQLGLKKPTPVQRTIIPLLVRNRSCNVLALAETGSGKTASFVLPIIHHCVVDPYGIYAIIITPTRELAKQIHQQIIALGTLYKISSCLVIGGLDAVTQSNQLDTICPHFVVATPGRFAELLRGPKPPRIQHVRYIVFDEADRLLASNSGFEKDIAELLLHCHNSSTNPNRKKHTTCQKLFFSATMSKSLESIEELTNMGSSSLPLKKFVISGSGVKEGTWQKDAVNSKKQNVDEATKSNSTVGDQNEMNSEKANNNAAGTSNDSSTISTPKIPSGLKQEYIFMPSRVRDAYILTAIRTLMVNGGRPKNYSSQDRQAQKYQKGNHNNRYSKKVSTKNIDVDELINKGDDDDNDDNTNANTNLNTARSAILFVSTCERAAIVSGLLTQVGVANVALHSLLSQNRRLAALGTFVSEQVRIMVATDVASRGLDIPTVDLVMNCEIPRNPIQYIHRVGRTARAGKRGYALSFVSEEEIVLLQNCESLSGRTIDKCLSVTDEMALTMLNVTAKAIRVTKMKLNDIGFNELVQKVKQRKMNDRIQQQKKMKKLLSKNRTSKKQNTNESK